MPPKTLILHIGDHEIGSTTIQYAFAAKRGKLAGRQVQYPGTLSHNNLRGKLTLLSKPKGPHNEAADKFTQIAERFANSKADTLLLSAESLDGADPQQVKDMVDRFFTPVIDRLRIAAYVRPHAPRILSSFATQTKSGRFAGTLQEFHQSMLDKGRLMYQPRFSQWRETFGEAFRLRPYDGVRHVPNRRPAPGKPLAAAARPDAPEGAAVTPAQSLPADAPCLGLGIRASGCAPPSALKPHSAVTAPRARRSGTRTLSR